jgi:hypothetical protein
MNGAPEVWVSFYVWATRHPLYGLGFMYGPPAKRSPYNRRMPAFLFAHVHWLWIFLHFSRSLIHDWRTFAVVLALGFGQTFIALDSGYLAVKGVEEKFPKKIRNRHLRFFITLSIGLLLMTAGIGYLNDQSQHQAEVKAVEAVGREQKLQATLDDQNKIIGKADFGVRAVTETVKRGGSIDKVASQLEQIQQVLKSAQSVTQPATATQNPLSLMSNTELKNVVIAFAGRLHGKDLLMYDHLDEFQRLQRVLENPITRQSADATDNLKSQIAAKQQAFNDEINFVVQSDVPLANLYLAELLKRLGPQHGPITTFSADPNMTSINAFLGKSLYLDDLAHQLQP